MGFELGIFEDEQLGAEYIDWLVDDQSADIQAHFSKLWEYYTNSTYPTVPGRGSSHQGNDSGRCYYQAQEYGLPLRITGRIPSSSSQVFGSTGAGDIQRKEVVIENDIGWRVNAAVDFLFGKPISFVSRSPDSKKRAEIESILKALFSTNGGIGFFQDMAVLGSVYGFVDCLVRPGEAIFEQFTSSSSQSLSHEKVLLLVRMIDLELIEAPRALPVLDENDYKKTNYYVQHFYQRLNCLRGKNSVLSRLLSARGNGGNDSREVVAITEIISPDFWQRYVNKELTAEGEFPWGFLPVVHMQNVAQPYYYEGMSDVEPLIPLQDELNTRLSDRASRITFQAFKMYLGKGIEGFEDRPVLMLPLRSLVVMLQLRAKIYTSAKLEKQWTRQAVSLQSWPVF